MIPNWLFRAGVYTFILVEDEDYTSSLFKKSGLSQDKVYQLVLCFEKNKFIETRKEGSKRKMYLTDKGTKVQNLFKKIKEAI